MKNILKVGDIVLWRGNFGADPKQEAKVIGINVNFAPYPIESVEWEKVDSRVYMITLDNGCWCYGTQISQIEQPTPKHYSECNIHQKIFLKSHYMRVNGKRAHLSRANKLNNLTQTAIIGLLSRNV